MSGRTFADFARNLSACPAITNEDVLVAMQFGWLMGRLGDPEVAAAVLGDWGDNRPTDYHSIVSTVAT